MNIRTIIHNKYFVGVILVGLFALFTFPAGQVVGSDDMIFQQQTLAYPNVLSWVIHRYETWSGRVFSEGFVYIFNQLPIVYYKLVNTILFALLLGTLYLYHKTFTKPASSSKTAYMVMTSGILLYLLNPSTLSPGVLWMTGSMYYFWIAVIGLAGLYPLCVLTLRSSAVHPVLAAFGLTLSIVAASSQEQAGAVIVGISALLLLHQLYLRAHKQLPNHGSTYWSAAWFVASFVAYYLSLKSPGNALRLKSEVAYWLPDFYTMPLLHHIDFGMRWILDGLVNHAGFVLVATWFVLTVLFLKKKSLDMWDTLTYSILGLACSIAFGSGHSPLSAWTRFYSEWNTSIPSKTTYGIMLIWVLVLVITVLAPYVLYRNDRGIMYSMLLALSFASAAAICFSPTMYASGWRTLFIPLFCVSIILYFLISDMYDKISRRMSYLVLLIASVIAFSQYATLLSAILSHKTWLTY